MNRNRILSRAVAPALIGLAILETAYLGFPALRAGVLQLEVTRAARGERLAANLGCFGCHGPEGVGGVKNPGSEEGEVPAFNEQTQMMYVKSAQDIRDYILDGAPKRRREDPDYRAKMEAAALHMPAYREVLSEEQVEQLVGYLRATSGQMIPESEAEARGAELAQQLSCFSCHGPLGGGGVENPRSFKGYIPAFWGPDFDELVKSDDELRRWILKGQIPRISEHPIGGIIFRRQLVKMPAYERFLPAEDVDALIAYVRWIRAQAPAKLAVAKISF